MVRSPVRLVLVAVAVAMALDAGRAVASGCWLAPVDAVVVDPYRPPECAWCPGNRGIEYGTPTGTPVRAVAAGVVTFRGTIAGVGYVVVGHADGLRVTYGNVVDARFQVGDVVVARAIVGVTAGHLHLGVRDGDRYRDPAPMIGRLEWRVRLVPIDGREANPAPPPRLRCD